MWKKKSITTKITLKNSKSWALSYTCNAVLCNSGYSGYPCTVPNLRENISRILPLNLILDLGLQNAYLSKHSFNPVFNYFHYCLLDYQKLFKIY